MESQKTLNSKSNFEQENKVGVTTHLAFKIYYKSTVIKTMWWSEVKLLSHAQLFVTPWTIACQAPLSMGFSRQRILEWVDISSSMGSSWPRDQTCLLSGLAGKFFTTEPLEKPQTANYSWLTWPRRSQPVQLGLC